MFSGQTRIKDKVTTKTNKIKLTTWKFKNSYWVSNWTGKEIKNTKGVYSENNDG